MSDRLAGFRGIGSSNQGLQADVYELLPASVQALYTKEQWLWLGDSGKASLIERECNPEVFDE